ncbi:entericidin A/B family lipoprotein [Denitratisoma oestradiolicum]|nr:entericidin A/B family lipoprotein [Denitratisoma oestradiolicum]TWO81204.1 entericidin EcnAB [Denitratisoma oestradiolicum]
MKNLSVVLLTILLLTACSTLEGIGKDIKETGKAMQEAAE